MTTHRRIELVATHDMTESEWKDLFITIEQILKLKIVVDSMDPVRAGSIKSEAKAISSRLNGLRGGRPRKNY